MPIGAAIVQDDNCSKDTVLGKLKIQHSRLADACSGDLPCLLFKVGESHCPESLFPGAGIYLNVHCIYIFVMIDPVISAFLLATTEICTESSHASFCLEDLSLLPSEKLAPFWRNSRSGDREAPPADAPPSLQGAPLFPQRRNRGRCVDEAARPTLMMSQPPQPPPPHFASRFAGPPQPAGFPPPALPPPGPFRGPPPQPFPRGLYPPFPGGGLPPFLPPPPPLHPPPQWPPTLPERPPLSWRPVTPPRPTPEASDVPGDEACDGDEAWLSRFVRRRRPIAAPPRRERGLTADEAAQAAGEALRAVARVAGLCAAWRRRGDEATPGETAEAEAGLEELRALVGPLRDPGALERLRARLERGRQKRKRRQQRRQEARDARQEEEARRAERKARIDLWRARRAQEEEDRHREKELKAAADSVLSEVRKKQADTKRMAEILRGLEKLRKLRKEAAGRKGVCPPPAADEAFESEVENLKASIKKRTELYEAEERALRVMLEGEQEEERKRDMEKKLKKEREKLLQQKRNMDSKLFGDPEEFPFSHVLEPFTQYYLQAEYSLPALLQIRHEWDQYLVPTDHPEGDFIPPGWVLPSPPSSDTWATAVR